jgi:hypothetical protein
MKHMMMILSLTVLSTIAHAAPKHIALCELEQAEEDITASDLVDISSLNVAEVNSLTSFQLKLANKYLVHQEYFANDLSFAEIKSMFSKDGEHQFDELHISSYQAKSSGIVYNQVHSYPGDNYYGLIFDINGNQVADIQDGSITIIENGQRLNCYELVPQ